MKEIHDMCELENTSIFLSGTKILLLRSTSMERAI